MGRGQRASLREGNKGQRALGSSSLERATWVAKLQTWVLRVEVQLGLAGGGGLACHLDSWSAA